jgi:hypothetical protein
MKILQQAASVRGYRSFRLAEDNVYGIPSIAETGALPDGQDFAVFWNGEWREGRCSMDLGGNLTFVTYGDALRIPLDMETGIDIRLPNYVLTAERVLDLARQYADELGYTTIQECRCISTQTSIAAEELAHVVVSVGQERPPVNITINLSMWGEVRLITETEIQRLAASPFEREVSTE